MRRVAAIGIFGLAALAGLAGVGWLGLHPMMPGAGATYQDAPDQVAAGGTAQLSLRLAVWGAGGPASARYRDVMLQTHSGDEAQWRAWPPQRVVTDHALGQSFHFELPVPNSPDGWIDYRFTFVFDGRPNTVDGLKRIRIVAATAGSS